MAEAETGGGRPNLEKGTGAAGKTLRVLVKVAIVIAIAYVMAAGYMYFNQRGFVFVPTGELSTPQEKGLEDISVEQATMADGTKITVWRAEPTKADAPTVLYLHGNSRTLSARWKRFKQIVESGYGLYAPTYRGYAGAEGSPSETALIADALEHFDRAAKAGQPIILHGESLGTGVATAVAAERPEVDLLVLEAPYTALVDMASEQYPWLPVAFLMKDPMPTRERIGRIESPVLIMHGTEDRVIPVEHGRRLFEFAGDPKELVIVEGGAHGDLWTRGLWDKVRSVWKSLGQET